jgi:hypothetical protein
VHFTSTDGKAVLPADYTFTAADAGTHTFAVTFKTAGAQSVTATDTAAGALTATASVSVSAAAATALRLSAPASATAGTSFSVTVALTDAYGNTATGYRGTVHFTSTDGKAVLPADYTFTAADAGTHTFAVTLATAGAQSIIAADTATGAVTGNASVSVNPAPVAPPAPPTPVTPPVPVPVTPPAPPAPTPSETTDRPIVIDPPTDTGVVRVLNPDGSLRMSLVPYDGFLGRVVAAAGDVTGDGVADIVTVAGMNGHVKVFDGQTGKEVWSFFAFPGYNGPVSIAVGDINGDGRADVLVSANLNGHVKAFDGQTGNLIASFFAYAGFMGPVALATADLYGDGRVEIVTAADGGGGVHIKAFDPATDLLVASFMATGPGASTGYALAAADFDGDGTDELLVAQGSQIRVLNGATQDVVGDFNAFPGFDGPITVDAAQSNGEPLPELVAIASDPSTGKPQVSVFDGPAGGLLDSFRVG